VRRYKEPEISTRGSTKTRKRTNSSEDTDGRKLKEHAFNSHAQPGLTSPSRLLMFQRPHAMVRAATNKRVPELWVIWEDDGSTKDVKNATFHAVCKIAWAGDDRMAKRNNNLQQQQHWTVAA
jgi:hypothetical protein